MSKFNTVEEIYRARERLSSLPPWDDLSDEAKLDYAWFLVERAIFGTYDDFYVHDSYVHDAFKKIKEAREGPA